MPALPEVLQATRQEIYPDGLTDTFFTKTPTLARARQTTVEWSGGAFMEGIFRHSPMIATSYKLGQPFTAIKRPTTDLQQFDIKYYNSQIPEIWEELVVLNANGPEQVFSLLDEDCSNAVDTIETRLAIDLFGGGVEDDSKINGFDEAIGHATLPSWNSSTARTVYGVASRAVYPELNGNVLWLGDASGATAGPSFNKVNKCYTAARRGVETVELIVMNKSLLGAIEDKMQAQQIMIDYAVDPFWGGDGFRLKKALVTIDEYCPSLADGQNNVQTKGLGNFLTGTITGPVSTTPPGGFPPGNGSVGVTLNVGETMWGFNYKFFSFRLSDAPEFQFGMTEFMRNSDSHKLVSEINAACNNLCYAGSRFQFQAYGLSAS